VERTAVLIEMIVNNLDEAVCLFDRDGSLIFMNKAGEEFFGRSLGEIKHIEDLFSDADDITMLMQKTINEGRLYNCKEMDVDIGRIANVDLNLAPFYLDNNIQGAILSVRENLSLTEREDYHFDSLLYLFGSIAHEIKNPLSGIRGAAQILKGNAENPDTIECTNLILKETDRLNSILQGYLTITRKPSFNKLNIHEVLEHAVKVMSTKIAEKKILIDKSYDPSLPGIYGDEGKLLQVFINLLKNAIEAMETSKNIRVLSISTRLSNEYMLIYEKGDINKKKKRRTKKQRWVVVNVQDTGIGLHREEINRIFLPFYTKKEGGSGLGLALSKKIVRDHGGIIKAKSSAGSGSIFSVYLPFQSTVDGQTPATRKKKKN